MVPIGPVGKPVAHPLAPETAVVVALIHEFRREDLAVTYKLSLMIELFEQYVERIAWANIQDEVDIPLEDLGQAHGQIVR